MNYKKRYHFIDQLRGFAIILMVIFHLSYDLTSFGFLRIDFYQDIVWLIFPRIIVFLFLFCVGLSMPLSHSPKIQWQKFGMRFGKIAVAALIISIFTYFTFPKQWVYFGTLHCIATCSLIALPFLNRPKTAAIISGIIIIMITFGVHFPWIMLQHKSMDYIPALPWIWVVLAGIFANSIGIHRLKTPTISKLEFLGKHSLIIYLIHQPLLFGLVYLITIFK